MKPTTRFKVLILRIGSINNEVLESICNGLNGSYEGISCAILSEMMQLPNQALDTLRNQYYSSLILKNISELKESKRFNADRILGVTNVDLYVPTIDFVFGEAQYKGKVALISLYRLRPEFYNQPPNQSLLKNRASKEATHEIGHTLGLVHCHDSKCVMYFSNSIYDTDKKRIQFCEKCRTAIK